MRISVLVDGEAARGDEALDALAILGGNDAPRELVLEYGPALPSN